MINFKSSYAVLLDEYITFQKSLGFYMSNRYHWKDIDNFLELHSSNESDVEITEFQFKEWYKLRPNETLINQYGRAIRLKQFSMYLIIKGYKAFIPQYIKCPKSVFIPYIFSTEEIKMLFTAADCLKSKKSSGSKEMGSIIFRLLYSTGLRVSELLSIELCDLKLYEEIPHIVIRNTKNRQDRLVVLSPSALSVLQTYLKERINGLSSFVFISNKGNSITPPMVYDWFRKTLEIANIPHRGRRYGPCVHSLRHSFSVHSLHEMSNQGLDLYYCLPILSLFLGHKSLEATDKYVRLTAEIYPELLKNMSTISKIIYGGIINEK